MRTLTTVYVTGVVARPKEIVKIPMNIRGGGVQFVFDDSWAGLIKNVVFISVEAADAANAPGIVETVAVANAPDIVEIPAEMVGIVGTSVSVGICGLNTDGTEIIPTLWADLGTVRPSAAGDFPPPAEQGLPVWAQIQTEVYKLNGRVDDLEKRGPEGGSITVAADGDTIIITTSLPVMADGDAIIIGGA